MLEPNTTIAARPAARGDDPTLSELIDRAAAGTRAAKCVADGVENVGEMSIDDLIAIARGCGAALSALAQIRERVTTPASARA